MSAFKAYERYKQSGVEWLGEVPEHWEVKRLKFLAQIKNGRDYKEVLADEGYPVIGSGGEFATASEYLYQGESVLLGRKGTIDKPLYVNKAFWTVDTMYYTEIFSTTNARFLYYCALTINFKRYATQTALPSMTQQDLSNIAFSVPDIPEQTTIAQFLDQKTAQIDALIAKKQQLLNKLAEQRTALISHAVTKGLNPHAPLKNSGVDWLGEVPEHWRIISLRYVFDFLNNQRLPISSEERGKMTDRIYPYYGASGIIDFVEDYIFDKDLILIAEDGANLLSRSTPLAFLATGEYWVNNHAHILEPKDKNLIFWIFVLCVIDYTPYISGSAQPKLTKESIGSLKLAVPPLEEQTTIAQYLDQKTAQLDQMAAKVKTVIQKLKEYRAALITQAVTGKIDVRSLGTKEN